MGQGTAIRKGAPTSDVQKRLMEIVDAIENGATVELKEVRIARMLNARITALESALRQISDSDPDESAGRLRDIANEVLGYE